MLKLELCFQAKYENISSRLGEYISLNCQDISICNIYPLPDLMVYVFNTSSWRVETVRW